MGLFDKKYCDVCGEKIGLLGNRKLEDANLCKKCASKLSPWFSDRRHSTLEEIKEQLAYREENLQAVKEFHTTRTLGRNMKVLVDDDAKKFMVTREKNLEEANPDVIDFSDVTGVDRRVDEHRNEKTHEDKEGNQVSYDPPRYEYSYDFYMTINVNNPYFDEIKFQLNTFSIDTGECRMDASGNALNAAPTVNAGAGNLAAGILGALVNAAAPLAAASPEYMEYFKMGEEIRDTLLQVRDSIREETAAAQAPKIVVTCPYCTATTTPTPDGRCEYCGGSLQVQ